MTLDYGQFSAGPDIFKFQKINDTIRGVVMEAGSHQFDDAKPAVPQYVLDVEEGGAVSDGDRMSAGEYTLTVGQVDLMRKMAKNNVQVGDVVEIAWTDHVSAGGTFKKKVFSVKVVKAASVPKGKAPAGQGDNPPF
jgi:hypothetical protein